jgi:tRNA nucleotidyltransferase (CCA-adding enzyme)
MTFSRPANSDLSALLEQALSPEQGALLRLVAGDATAQGLALYIVGGYVRDLLLDRPAADFDLVVEGNAIAFARGLAAKHAGKVTTHSQFGTAQWFLPRSFVSPDSRPAILDLISSRSETYKRPAALPTVRMGTIADDLRRRDFTVNTLAIRLDGVHFGELRDDLGGLDDLQKQILRPLHPRSFLDDPTRIFRLIRYEQRLGFQIDAQTLALIPEALPLIDELSAERLRHELDLVLEEQASASMLGRLAELGVLAAAHPALGWDASIRARVEKVSAVSAEERLTFCWMLWLMHLPRPDLEQVKDRFHFKVGLREDLFAASKLYASLDALKGKKTSQCVAILDGSPPAVVKALSLVAADADVRRKLHAYLETWRQVKPKTTGHTLKKYGLQPGPAYQKILWQLRAAWLDEDVKTAEEETALLQKLLVQG